jgi:cell division protein FtsB
MKKQLKIITILIGCFVIYMTFFDQNNWLLQKERMDNLNKTKNHIAYLKEENNLMEQELAGLSENQEVIEKYARQKYYHKKDNEDVYIVIDTSQTTN